MTSGVYCIENLKNGKRYIGCSFKVEKRIVSQKSNLKRSHLNKKYVNADLYNDVVKYGINNFIFYILEIFEKTSEKELKNREWYWIDKLNTTDESGGYNRRVDKNGKYIAHEKTKSILREIFKGEGNPNYNNKWGNKQKKKASLIQKKRHLSGYYGEDWREKVRSTIIERMKSPEYRKKISESVSASKCKKNKFIQLTKGGEVIREWDTLKDIISANPEYKWQNIYSVCNGYKKSYMGYVWKKIPK